MAASKVESSIWKGSTVEVMPGRLPVSRGLERQANGDISVEQAGGVLYEAGRTQGKAEQAREDRALLVQAREQAGREGQARGFKLGVQAEIDYRAKRKLRKAQKIEARERGMTWEEYVTETPAAITRSALERARPA